MKKHKIILAYHSVGECPVKEAGAGLYCVSRDDFRQQMEYVARVDGQGSMVNGVEVTFDDGDVTNYTNVFPILKELKLKAYFFPIGERIGKPGYMDWREIRELQNAGMVIGSHGMTHRILIGLKDNELDYELGKSKKFLEDNLGCGIEYFSVPRGFYNLKIINKAKKFGYRAIFTSNNRVAVRPDWNPEHFIHVLQKGYTVRERGLELAKDLSKKLLGAANYDKIRTKFLKPMSSGL